MAIVKSFKADVSSVSPSSERTEKLWVVFVSICRKSSYAIGGNMVMRKTRRKLVEWKAEGRFERKIFVPEICDFPNCLDVGQGRKLPHAAWNDRRDLVTGLKASLSFLSRSRRCSRNRSSSRLLVSPMYNFLQLVLVMALVECTWSDQ